MDGEKMRNIATNTKQGISFPFQLRATRKP